MPSSKQALVIGNQNYSASLRLDNPLNDAAAMIELLGSLGVDVIPGLDASFERITNLIDEFVRRINQQSVSTSILYYSGHALQHEDKNYIVPVDFDRSEIENTTKLISIQHILDRMSTETTVRIVFLDACRSNIDARKFVTDKDVIIEGVTRAFSFAGEMLPKPGLAEMRASGNTFIAFAASPGDVAYDGVAGAVLSPFTESLVHHLKAVDLPLPNITSRVRQDVLDQTRGLQRTWDQSSLTAPFYFNPGALLTFSGNLMSLLGFGLAACTYSLVLLTPNLPSWGWIAGALVLPATCLVIFLAGIHRVYARLRGVTASDLDKASRAGRGASEDPNQAIIGGFLGSTCAAPVLAAFYYVQWERPSESFGQCLLEITYATAFAACPLAYLSTFFARAAARSRWFARRSMAGWLSTLCGASGGGMLAGLLTAPFLTAYFGLIEGRPQMTPVLLLPGAIVGAAVLIVAIVGFDLERLSRRRLRATGYSALAALLSGVLATGAVFGPLALLGIVDRVIAWLQANWQNPVVLAEGGAVYGPPVGLVLGFVIGTAIVLTHRWSREPVQPR